MDTAFLEKFFAGTKHPIELRVFGGNKGAIGEQIFSRDFAELGRFAAQHMAKGVNVYFGCATRDGRRHPELKSNTLGGKVNCREITALWCEIDFKETPRDKALERISAFKFPPSIVISSGGGLHLYWLLAAPIDAQDARIEPTLKRIVDVLHADPACKDIARVLRPPQTKNFKYAVPQDVMVVKEEWNRRYRLEDFANVGVNGDGPKTAYGVPPAQWTRQPGDENELGLHVPAHVDFTAELARRLKFEKYIEGDRTYYNYHNLAGIDGAPQACLIQRSIHEANRGNARQCAFVVEGGRLLFHTCFDSDCRGTTNTMPHGEGCDFRPDQLPSKTRRALMFLDELNPNLPSLEELLTGEARQTTAIVTEPQPDSEEAPAKSPDIPPCDPDIVDGDLLGELTHLLRDGTPVPPQFVRENIKTILGTLITGRASIAKHRNIHLREYHLMISINPETGKGQSWEITGAKHSGYLWQAFMNGTIAHINGGLFGSGEYIAKVLSRPGNERSIAWFDEMAAVFKKDRNANSVIELALLQLFDGNAIAQGSFKNKEHSAENVELSVVGAFTLPKFLESFTGSGSGGSGFLSRCVFSYSDRMPHRGEWAEVDRTAVFQTCSEIAARIEKLSDGYVVPETDEAHAHRLETEAWIQGLDARYKPRLESHARRDLILRAVFSREGMIDLDKARRTRLWVKNQYENRLVLWPDDAGSLIERTECAVLRALANSKSPLSVAALIKACNTRRLGSGGSGILHQAILNLTRLNEIKAVGRTRKGRACYTLFD
jgi:hypothetical protein